MMRILFIEHEGGLGGASRVLAKLANEFAKDNDVFVLTPYKNTSMEQLLDKNHITVLPGTFHWWRFPYDHSSQWFRNCFKWYAKRKIVCLSSAIRLARFIKENHIDVIHSNCSVINIGLLLSKLTGVKHVWHIHEFGETDFNMRYFENKKHVCKMMNKYTDKFVFVSNAVAVHYPMLDNAKKTVIYNGVNPELTEYNKSPNPNNICFLIAGRIGEGKGQDEAVQAGEILLARGISNFTIHLAGTGVLSVTPSAEMQKHLVLHGQVENMPDLRETMDVGLVCSQCEAFGLVTVEAMMSGMPVIGSNTGGTPELINVQNGLLYEKGNVTDLADKMAYFIQNPDEITRMGKNAWEYANDNFTCDAFVVNMKRVYNEVLNN